eukprot:6481763-Amphidinium_carterae.4
MAGGPFGPLAVFERWLWFRRSAVADRGRWPLGTVALSVSERWLEFCGRRWPTGGVGHTMIGTIEGSYLSLRVKLRCLVFNTNVRCCTQNCPKPLAPNPSAL